MQSIDFPFEAIDTLRFSKQRAPLSASNRPLYRIALLLLILYLDCSRETASLLKLQFFNWALKNPRLQASLESRIQSRSALVLDVVHFDPAVNLALRYALAEGLVVVTGNGKYRLTPAGRNMARLVKGDSSPLLTDEIAFLEGVGKRISEVKLRGGLI